MAIRSNSVVVGDACRPHRRFRGSVPGQTPVSLNPCSDRVSNASHLARRYFRPTSVCLPSICGGTFPFLSAAARNRHDVVGELIVLVLATMPPRPAMP